MRVASSRFAIAVHTLCVLGFLERRGVGSASSKLIAQSVNTNAVVIRNLIQSLKRAGLIESKEGKSGGVHLAKSPTKLTLLEIFKAVENPKILGLNKKPEFAPCPVSCGMGRILPGIFNDVDQAVAKTLKGMTLKEVIDRIG